MVDRLTWPEDADVLRPLLGEPLAKALDEGTYLVTGMDEPARNGIYTVTAAGSWTRAADDDPYDPEPEDLLNDDQYNVWMDEQDRMLEERDE